MGMCQSTRRYCECPCLFTKYERATEMKKTSRAARRPKDVQESKSNVIVHDMLPVETPLREETHSKKTTRPHSLPTLRQHIFINIEASPRTRTPSSEWTTPRSETPPYCQLHHDTNTFTFMIDDEKVKDVYVNYEKIRSKSL